LNLQSESNLTFFATFPIGRAVEFDLDQDNAWSIHAIFEPFVELTCSVLMKDGLVADQFGSPFDGHLDPFGE